MTDKEKVARIRRAIVSGDYSIIPKLLDPEPLKPKTVEYEVEKRDEWLGIQVKRAERTLVTTERLYELPGLIIDGYIFSHLEGMEGEVAVSTPHLTAARPGWKAVFVRYEK